MNSVRVTAIACLMPLSELDEDPFLVDDRGQHDMCKQWAAARDYHLTCRLQPAPAARRPPRAVAGRRRGPGRCVRGAQPPDPGERHRLYADDFTARCAEAGVRLETADLQEPVYTLAMKSQVHRRLSMPTAGYHGC